MDLKQTVEIPLEEYLELRELKENERYVRIEHSTYVDVNNGKEYKKRGGQVSWKSAGETWVTLADALDDSERRLSAILDTSIAFIRSLKRMSWFEFRRLKKEIRIAPDSRSALNRLIPGWEAYLPKEVLESEEGGE